VKIGIVGLGAMGSGIAQLVVEAGSTRSAARVDVSVRDVA